MTSRGRSQPSAASAGSQTRGGGSPARRVKGDLQTEAAAAAAGGGMLSSRGLRRICVASYPRPPLGFLIICADKGFTDSIPRLSCRPPGCVVVPDWCDTGNEKKIQY